MPRESSVKRTIQNFFKTAMRGRAKVLSLAASGMGVAGLPDMLVLLEGGRTLFIECKATRGRLSQVQQAQIAALALLGHRTVVVWPADKMPEIRERLKDAIGLAMENSR